MKTNYKICLLLLMLAIGLTFCSPKTDRSDEQTAETGKKQGQISSTAPSITLIPSAYRVTFGNIDWETEVKAGETMVLNAGQNDIWFDLEARFYLNFSLQNSTK